jgi:hypothetical protein
MSKLPDHPRCYNAGKISGMSYLQAYNKFLQADRHIVRLGYNPVNPMICGLRASRPWWMHLVYDLFLLARCEFVAFQKDWLDSRGAKIEHCVARFLRKKIYSL